MILPYLHEEIVVQCSDQGGKVVVSDSIPIKLNSLVMSNNISLYCKNNFQQVEQNKYQPEFIY